MDELRICIIGAGILSTKRIYPYIGAAGGCIAGVCAIHMEKAKKNAHRFGGNAYTDVNSMLEKEKPDGVMICIGPEQHSEMAKMVMKLGIPVYTEKPPALNADEAIEVARVSKETGVLCTTAFKKRYNNAYSRAKQWIEKFPEKDLYSISIDYASEQYLNDSDAKSFLLDFAIHAIDLLVYLFGDAKKVFCFSKEMDAYSVSIKFANGAVGSMNLNDGRSLTIPTEEVEISIKGGNFMRIHNSSQWWICENEKPVEWRDPPTFTSAGDSGYDTGHLAEIEDFFKAVQEGRTTRSNIFESCKSMILYDAIKESSSKQQVVNIDYSAIRDIIEQSYE